MGSPFQTIFKFIGQTKPNVAWIFLGLGLFSWILFGCCFLVYGFDTNNSGKWVLGIFATLITGVGVVGDYMERTANADSVRDTLSESSKD